jgi:hypothetical protein
MFIIHALDSIIIIGPRVVVGSNLFRPHFEYAQIAAAYFSIKYIIIGRGLYDNLS